jgi:hypothetical protein
MKLLGCYSPVWQVLLAACVGCSDSGTTVQGTVTIDGQIARQGTVQFHPVEEGPTAYSTVSANGSYALRVGQGNLNDPNAGEVPPGEYIVTAVVNMPSVKDETSGGSHPPLPGARLTAEKYSSKDTSDLRVTIKAGQNIVPLDLEGWADEETESPVENADEAEVSDSEGQIGQESAAADGESPTDEPEEEAQAVSTEEPLQ